MLEKEVDFIDVDPGVLPHFAVMDDPVEHAVQHYQHSNRQKLLAQVPDIVAENPGVGIHVGGLGEGVQAALGEELNCQRHVAGLRFRLPEQLGVEVLESGGGALVAVSDVVVIDPSGAAIDDGFFLGGELAGADQLLTEGQQELGLQHHGVLPVAVTLFHVHGVDVVPRGCGDIDHLAAQALNQRAIFAFGIDNDDIVVRGEGNAGDLLLGGEGLAGAGDAQNEAVSVQQFLPVGNDEVFADYILPVVHAALADGILFAMVGIVALFWVVTLARHLWELLEDLRSEWTAARLLAQRVRQARLAGESIVSTSGL